MDKIPVLISRPFKLILLIFLLCIPISSYSQELLCNISINSQQVEGSNKQVYTTLQTALNEFMNKRTWTNHIYQVNERIECSILITIQEQLGADEFRGTIQVQSRRPIYNSSYNTVMLNYLDQNFNFQYVEYETLELNENTHQSNLTAVLGYYAYLILGLDYDSYSLFGGTDFYTKAERIVNNAQNSNDRGWKPFESRSNKGRYWLIKNILDKRYEPVREFIYRYHRLGLDIMSNKINEGRAEIADALELLQKVYRQKPDPYLHFMNVILEAKTDELVNIFSDGMPDEKTRVYQILSEIDNSNIAKYKKIIGQQ
jgi:hypothetical protein